jgi:hypothetical protein
MVSFFKSLQSVLANVFADLPEAVKVLTEFLWRLRWFLFCGWVTFLVWAMVMKMLPYLMWSFVLKGVFGSLSSLFL